MPNRKIGRCAIVPIRAACLLAAACLAAKRIPPAAAAETPSGSIVEVADPLDLPVPNRDFIAVAAGVNLLGLKADGSIVAVEANESGESDVPSPNTGFIAVAAGVTQVCGWLCYDHGYSLGLRADGSIVEWGNDGSGPFTLAQPNSDFIAIAAGGGSALGIRQIGACCDLLARTCEDDVGQSQCAGAQQLWTNGAAYVDVVCDATPGACCNHHAAPLAIEGICEETTINECTCDGCDWTKGATCAEITCDADFVGIPAVSEWGLMVLALSLLVGVKVSMLRSRASTGTSAIGRHS